MHVAEPIIGNEERFQWQKSKSASDVSYTLPDCKMTRSVVFSCSRRTGEDATSSNKTSTGPGSYDSSKIDFSSEHVMTKANKFGAAARQSMALKTPSPGAVYNIENTYWNGPVKKMGIGFNCDSRPDLNSTNVSNAEMMLIKPSAGPSITMGARFKPKRFTGVNTPGAIYDVHVSAFPLASFLH